MIVEVVIYFVVVVVICKLFQKRLILILTIPLDEEVSSGESKTVDGLLHTYCSMST